MNQKQWKFILRAKDMRNCQSIRYSCIGLEDEEIITTAKHSIPYINLNQFEQSPLFLESKESWTVWKLVVFRVLVGVTTLVQQLQVAWVNGVCLVSIAGDKLSMTDVVRPASSRIRLAREWSAFSCGVRRPLAIKAGSRE